MCLTRFPKSKDILLSYFLLLSSCIFMLLANACSTVPRKSCLQRDCVACATIDSIVSEVTTVDSLNMLLAKYQDNEYGQMVVHKALADLYRTNSEYMQAIDELNSSLVLAEKLRDTLYIVENLNSLGAGLRYLGVTGQSAEYFFRALVISDQWSRKSTPIALENRASSLTGIGRAQYTLENYVRSDAAFRLALEYQKKRNDAKGQAESYANLGKLKETAGQYDSAFFYYERSLELNRGVDSKDGIAVCYNHFGRLAESKKDLDAALRYYYRAYYIASENQSGELLMESALSMARVYMKRKDLKRALRFIDEGWKQAYDTRSWKMMARASLLQSEYAESIGNVADALKLYKRSIAYKDSVTNERTMMFVQKIRQQYVTEKHAKELEVLSQNYTRVRKDSRAFIAWTVMGGLFAVLLIIFLLYVLKVRLRTQKIMLQMEKIRTDFFTNITHELRTPLTVMLGLGKQIQDNKGNLTEQESQKIGSMMLRQGYCLLDLVDQLLDIARAESEVGREEWRNGDIAPYISMIIENCQVFAEKKNVTLAFASSERVLMMDFVPDYIQKVLRNLLTNAIKYSGNGGKVTVQMRRKGKSMLLVVTDTGRGVPAEDLDHVFDAFYTATNWGIEVSTGVGLAMVKQMIVAMGGTVNVESTLGRGTTFNITLPLKQKGKTFATLEKDYYEKVGKEYVASQYIDKGEVPEDELEDVIKPIVLIIEDNRDVATYVGMQLTGTYRVAYAMNGKEGLERAEKLVPDLIVTDLMMPLIDGYEVCRQMRSSESLNNIPIIILSAKSTEADKLKGLEAGADAYLYKPFNADEFKLTVANLIDKSRVLKSKTTTALSSSGPSETVLKPFEREFLNKFVDVVYSQMPKGNIDAESLASIMCMSSSQLRRRIFAITGEKLTTYVLQIRLKHAQQLLTGQGDMPVADVASRCGFEDAAYFSRIFKNFYQMTPSQYRKQVR